MNFCTLFDENYLTRGLALADSLRRHAPGSRLWILCMTPETEAILRSLQTTHAPELDHVTLLSLAELEREEGAPLLAAKKKRSAMEYCWTLTPLLPRLILRQHPDLEHVTYVDADVYFFRDPRVLLQELGDGSVLVFEHGFPTRLRHQEETVGRFNVEVLVFKNQLEARTCLDRWSDQCIEWCFHRVEPGRMGDQKYLDEWPRLYPGLVIAGPRVPGLAPWNLETFAFGERSPQNVPPQLLADAEPVLFCHFSKLSILSERTYRYCKGYRIPSQVQRLAYEPYTQELTRQFARVRAVRPGFSAGIVEIPLREQIGDAWHQFKSHFSPT